MNKNIKKYNGLAHPPLSGKSLTGRGFWVLGRPFFEGKKGLRGTKNIVIPNSYRIQVRTTRTSLAHFVSFRNLFIDKTHKHEMLNQVQHDMLYNAPHCKSKSAFTLAEVLITLVIIGVVAALTLPTLMTKYQQHVLSNQFKKSLYTISQIVANVRSELGVSKLAQYCTEYDNTRFYYNSNECGEAINKHLRKTSTEKQSPYINGSLYTINRNNEIIKTYNNKVNATEFDYNVSSMFRVNQLPDGSFLGFNINGNKLNFGVDLNGYKKPNRLGYDIFIFNIKKTNDTITGFMDTAPSNVSDSDAEERYQDNNAQRLQYGSPCNLESTRESNGIGCAYYALRNKCPYDDTKTYWECLK